MHFGSTQQFIRLIPDPADLQRNNGLSYWRWNLDIQIQMLFKYFMVANRDQRTAQVKIRKHMQIKHD